MIKAMRTFGVSFVLLLAADLRAQDWPQWRGPNRDNKVNGFVEPKTWPKELTKKWQVSVGIGESSPVLVGDKIFAFARDGDDEAIVCLNATSGKEIWKYKYATPAITGADSKKFPGPRSTPAAADGKICTFGVNGVISCVDTATGKEAWTKQTKSETQFHTSTSPLIADGKCIIYSAELTAYDLANGDAKWQWKGSGAPYGSPVLMTVDGVKQLVAPTENTLAGVALADGKLLWEVKLPAGNWTINYDTPIIDGSAVIYFVAAKKVGGSAMAFKVEKKEGGFGTTELWNMKKLNADQYQTPVLRDGLLFGLTPGANLFCADAKSGNELWVDKTKRGECGATLNAGSVLFSLTSDKNLVAFKPSAEGFMEVAKYVVADEETWATPIVAGHRIYVRDKKGSLTLWTID
jgi:outer membrane protein assembly factor BamB